MGFIRIKVRDVVKPTVRPMLVDCLAARLSSFDFCNVNSC